MSIGALLQDLPRRLSASLGLRRPKLKPDGDLERHHSPLPYDILQNVMDHLDTSDLLRVKQVNSTFYSAASSRHRHAVLLAGVPTIRGGGMPAHTVPFEDITHVLKREVALGRRLSQGRCESRVWMSQVGAQRATPVGNGQFVVTRVKTKNARIGIREKLDEVPRYAAALTLATSGIARPLAFAKAGMRSPDIKRVNKLLSYQRNIEALRRASARHAYELWDVSGSRPRSLKLSLDKWLYSHVAVDPEGRHALLVDADGIVSTMSLAPRLGHRSVVPMPLPVLDVLVASDQRGYVFALLDGIYAGDLRERTPMRRVLNSPAMDAVRVSGERALLTFRENNERRFSVWSFKDGAQQLATFGLQDTQLRVNAYLAGPQGHFALFQDHRSLLSLDLDSLADGATNLRPTPLGRIFGRNRVAKNDAANIVAQPRESCVAVAQLTRNSTIIKRIDPDYRRITHTALSPDGNRLAIANCGWLELVNVRGPQTKDLLQEHTHPADVVTFSHDGAFLATAATGQVHVWRFVDGALKGNRLPVATDSRATDVQVAEDSQVVTATFEDGTVAHCNFAPLPEPARATAHS